MKFKSNIELQAGLEDNNAASGTVGQVLSSTGTGVEWIDQEALTETQANLVYFNVKNSSGSTINKGKGVMAVGTDGNSGHILIDEMVADGSVEPKYFLGVLETTVANGGFARVISFGQLDQFDTRGQNGETWNDGDILWCDPDSAGDFTITEPDGPNVKIAAAIVLNASTNGKIQVRVQANEGIHDLHDTKITTQADGELLVWNNTLGVWQNDGTATVDYTNSRVGIGTASPATKLHLSLASSGASPYQVITTPLTLENSGRVILQMLGPADQYLMFGDTTTANQAWLSYNHATDQMGLHTGSTITMDGKVGIGTTSPVGKLEVVTEDSNRYIRFKAPNGEERFQFYTGGTGNPAGLYMYSEDGTTRNVQISAGGTSYFNGGNVFFNGGNVGIGTNSASAKLNIANEGEGEFAGANSNSAGGSHLILRDEGGTSRTLMSGPSIVFQTPANSDGTNIWATSRILGSPSAAGSARGTISLQVRDNYDPLNDGTSWNWRTALTVINTGNVGIGTTSPGYKLEVSGNTALSLGADRYLRIGSSTNYWWDLQSVSNDFTLKEAGSNTRVIVKAGGNVGIGTTSPDQKLQVVGNVVAGASASSTANGIYLGGTSQYYGAALIGSSSSYAPTGKLSIQIPTHGAGTDYGLTEQMVIEVTSPDTKAGRIIMLPNGGNVGIGTTNPSYPLEISGTSTVSLAYQRTGVSAKKWGFHSDNSNTYWQNLTDNILALTLSNAGNVGIGTASPGAALQVHNGTKLYSNGVLTWGASADYGTLTWDTGKAIVKAQSGKELHLGANNQNSQLVITSAGNVGIGTTSPGNSLSIAADNPSTTTLGTNFGQFGIFNALNQYGIQQWVTGSGNGHIQVGRIDSIATAYDLILQELGGNVGIGTTSPNGKLDVTDTSTLPAISITSDGGNEQLRIRRYSNNNEQLILGFHSSDYAQIQSVEQGVAYRPLALNPSGGNVGIGTTSPSYKMHIKGDSTWGLGIDSGASQYSVLEFLENGSVKSQIFNNHPDDSLFIRTTVSSSVRFGTNSSERMRIDSSGNVGIGTTSPNSYSNIKGLTIDGLSGSLVDFEVNGTLKGEIFASTSNLNINAYDTHNIVFTTGAGSERLRIDSSGNVGIGTTNPAYKLDVNGGAGVALRLNSTADSQLMLNSSNSWTGIGFNDGAASGTDYIWHNGVNQTFAIGGGGSNVSGKKLHVHGATTIGTGLAGTAVPTNGLLVEGNVGIGTTSPSAKLDVVGDVKSSVGFSSKGTTRKYFWDIQNTGNSGTIWKKIGVFYAAGQSSRIMITATGTTSYSSSTKPGKYTLLAQVNNNNLLEGTYWSEGMNAAFGSFVFRSISGVEHEIYMEVGSYAEYALEAIISDGTFVGEDTTIQATIPSTHTPNREWRVNNSLFVDSSGNVGIGTASPTSAKLVISGVSPANYVFDANGKIKIRGDGELTWGSLADYGRITWGSGKAVVRGESGIALSLGANGTQDTVYINTSQNVGIGTTSPSTRLHVYDSSSLDHITIDGNNGDNRNLRFATENSTRWNLYATGTSETGSNVGSDLTIARYTDAGAYNGNVLTILRNSGNVGIGTTSPIYTLDVNGTLHSSSITLADGIYHEGDTNTYMQFHGADQWRVVTGGAERLEVNNSAISSTIDNIINSNGTAEYYIANISNSSVASTNHSGFKLTELGTDRFGIYYTRDGLGKVRFENYGTQTFEWIRNGTTILDLNTSNNFDFKAGMTVRGAINNRIAQDNYIHTWTNESESNFAIRMYNDGTNNGTSVPAFRFGLEYGSTQNAAVLFYRGGGSTGGFLGFTTSTGVERLRIQASGNVSIGNTNDSYKLDVSGTGRFTSTVTATNFILSSDISLKQNIQDLKVKKINVNWKSYEFIQEGDYRVGVIAQELEQEHPEFVNTDDEGFKSVKYIDLLVAKIAELEARLEKLEK